MDHFERAKSLREELIQNRRRFHANAEVRLHMPEKSGLPYVRTGARLRSRLPRSNAAQRGGILSEGQGEIHVPACLAHCAVRRLAEHGG